MSERAGSPFSRTLIAVMAAVTFAVGVWQLGRVFVLRFEQADAYAPYSTLRSDPMGCRAFFEAVSIHPGVTAMRNTMDLYRIEVTPESVLILAGVPDSPDPVSLLEKIEGFVEGGARLTIAYTAWATNKSRIEKYIEKQQEKEKKGEKGEGEEEEGLSLIHI